MDDARTVWCGNLHENVTEELLYELFLQAAPLERVKIPTDKEGRKSSFAFITVKHEISIPYVTQLLNGISLYDRRITVKPRTGGGQNVHLQSPIDRHISNQKFNSPNNSFNRPRDNYKDDREYFREDMDHYNRHRHDSDNREHNVTRQNNYNSGRHGYNNRQGRNFNNRNYHERNHSRNRY